MPITRNDEIKPASMRKKPDVAPSAPSKKLDVFPNPSPKRDFHIHIQAPEFTCNCPLTSQPDFATITIDYIADKLCVELKSLKMFMWSFRDEGVFHEKVTNDILDALVKATEPRFMRVTTKWYVRGGVYTNVIAEHSKKGWKPAPRVDLARFDAASPVA
jgi:7-cyano-7-deazaguanine reductase